MYEVEKKIKRKPGIWVRDGLQFSYQLPVLYKNKDNVAKRWNLGWNIQWSAAVGGKDVKQPKIERSLEMYNQVPLIKADYSALNWQAAQRE